VAQLGGGPARRREDSVRVGGIAAVEADQGVKMYGAASLELRDFGVPESGRGAAVSLGEPMQLPFDRVDGARPELRDEGVPGDLCDVVIAVEAQGTPGPWVTVAVNDGARQGSTVRTGGPVPSGPAGTEPVAASAGPASAVRPGMDDTERWGSEGEEDRRVLTDRVRDALTAPEAGRDQVVGVPPVDLRAGRAHRLPTGAARLLERRVRKLVGVEGLEDLAGLGGDGGRRAP
jgi:hypothetical protein